MNENILIVEDEEALRMTLQDRLRSEGYVVDFAVDGEQGTEKATQLPFDLIILDIMLPRRSGLDVCMDIRRAGLATPILLLTARGQTSEKVVGFKLGADDYVTKPFDTLELMARIEALLRRAPTRTGAAPAGSSGIHQFGSITLDIRGTQVTRDGQAIYLTARDFERGPAGQAREALVELFDLLEEYGPSWYSEAHRAKALAAINALEES